MALDTSLGLVFSINKKLSNFKVNKELKFDHAWLNNPINKKIQ